MNSIFFPFNDLFISYISAGILNMDVQHYHDAYEIYLQVAGERYLFIDDTCYHIKEGDIIVLAPFDIHYMQSREIKHYERYVMNFSRESLGCILSTSELDELFKNFGSFLIHLNPDDCAAVYNLFRQADNASKKSGMFAQKLQYSAVFQLVSYINDIRGRSTSIENDVINPNIAQALSFINKHYKEDISLENAAESVHMSKYHFCRLFHETTGATFLEYLYNVRLRYVHRMLTETKLPLNIIAQKTGFTSQQHLSRVFRNTYKISPREFRKKAFNNTAE